MSQGVIYTAIGERYVQEATVSAASVKQQHPTLPITLFTNCDVTCRVFDDVIRVELAEHNRLNRIAAFSNSPYERTLALDTDTFVCGNITNLFSLLDHFEFGAAHAPNRQIAGGFRPEYESVNDIPVSFTELNSGVLLFKKSTAMDELLSTWFHLIEEEVRRLNQAAPGTKHALYDQPWLRKALYESRVHWLTLPSEYNCRLNVPGYVGVVVKIIHGRGCEYPLAARALNSRLGARTFHLKDGMLSIWHKDGTERRFCVGYCPISQSPLNWFRYTVQGRGARGTISHVTQRMFRRIEQSP